MSLGGFTVQSQTFLEVTQTTANLLSGTMTGIMGLAFPAISSTDSTPFWKSLSDSGQFTTKEFAFWLTRFRGDKTAEDEENGGVLTLGGVNSTLYQGDIEFLDMPSTSSSSDQETFWLLDMTGALLSSCQTQCSEP